MSNNSITQYKIDDKKIAKILKDKEKLVKEVSKIREDIDKKKKKLKKYGFKVERMKEKLQPLMKKLIERKDISIKEPIEVPNNVSLEDGKVVIKVLNRVESFKEHLIEEYEKQQKKAKEKEEEN